MKITFVVRNLSEEMYERLDPADMEACFDQLRKWATGDLKHCVTMKVGLNDSFRDKVEFNSARKRGAKFSDYKIEPRRGYKLATFEI